MKTKLISMAVALLAGSFVAHGADYLYWMVNVDDQPEFAFDYATVSLGGNVLLNYAGGSSSYSSKMVGSVENDDGDWTQTGQVYADITGNDSTSFLFELFSDEGSKLAQLSVSRSELSTHIHSGSMSQVTPFVASGFTAVPEPTSGLLLLLGFAGLALKRKRT